MPKLKQLFLFSLVCTLFFGFLTPVFAETDQNITISSTDYARTGRFYTYKLNPSIDGKVTWKFGIQSVRDTDEVVYKFDKPGTYTIEADFEDSGNTYKLKKEVSVFNKYYTYGGWEDQDSLSVYAPRMKVIGNLLLPLSVAKDYNEVPDMVLLSEDFLYKVRSVPENSDWQSSKVFIFYSGPYALISRLAKRFVANSNLQNITIINSSITNFMDSLLIKSDAEVISQAYTFGKYYIISNGTDTIRPWNFMSYAYDLMLKFGIPSDTLFLLILIPFYALLFLFFKQIIGLSFAGDIFNPIALAIIWQVLGIKLGLMFIITAIFFGIIFRFIYKGLYMSSAVKSGLFFSSMSIALFFAIYPISRFLPQITQTFSFQDSIFTIFPFIILIAVSERLLNLERTAGWRTTLSDYFEVGLISLVSFYALKPAYLRAYILAFPEILLLVILLILLIGRYTGLRLSEIWKFRKLIWGDKIDEDETE